MSLLSIFKTNQFKESSVASTPVNKTIVQPIVAKKEEPKAVTPSVDTVAIIAQAQAQAQNQAREIILAAKDEAFKLKDQAIKDARIQLEDIEIRAKTIAQKQQGLQILEDQAKKQKLALEASQKQADDMRAKIADEEAAMGKKLEKRAQKTSSYSRKNRHRKNNFNRAYCKRAELSSCCHKRLRHALGKSSARRLWPFARIAIAFLSRKTGCI